MTSQHRDTRSLIFHGRDYGYLAEELFQLHPDDFELGQLRSTLFGSALDPVGQREIGQRILSPIRNRDVILLGGLHNNAEIFPTLALAHALSGYGARSLTLVSPFTCYSTAERSVMAGEVVSFKVLARMISNIPGAQTGNCVVFCDLHKEGEERYIEGDLRVSHLYLDRPIVEAIQEVGGVHYKLVSPDLGRAKWIRSHARQLGVGSALVDKDRSANEVHAEVLYGDVSGWDVVLYDDMCRSGSSLREAARICRDHGAGKIYIVVSHGELNGNALQELRNSGLFAGLVTTNSHPKAVELARSGDFAGFLSVKSIAGMIAGHLRGDSGNR